ncbi:hypothetical protein [Texcoconibacillus texcoconensis]|uniref:Major membrane immunogen (Membrane-anchored lipoprotein) n=1 Tax=Texcoconibacillus texcoconensis TaxID=1095777 RepID=A0A840QT59_9BACI|nr:hypothetical protein [Texcoconibacillus texcoconensis]MBB5174712.1 major membrane immunogen (membrane-anchored lipoprotein) [Texcoconibacillus texcoconensis]
MKKAFIIMSVSLLFAGGAISPVAASEKNDKTIEEFNNSDEVKSNDNDELSFDDGSTIEIEDEGGKFITSHYDYKGELLAMSTLDKTTDILTTEYADGDVEEYHLEDLIEVNEGTANVEEEFTTMQYGTHIDTHYSNEWGETGYLYLDETTSYGTSYTFAYQAGDALVTIAGALAGYKTGGALPAVLAAFGTEFANDIILSPFEGTVRTRDRNTTYSVTSQGELGLEVEHGIVDTEAEDDLGNTYYVNPTEYGDDSMSNQEMLDMGIYNVVIDNL